MHVFPGVPDRRVPPTGWRRSAGLAAFAVATLTLGGAGRADELHPMEGGSVQLGAGWGSIYYTAEPDGYRVIATVAQTADDAPIRFVATLQPGQSVILSAARGAGENAAEVLIRRIGDRVVFQSNTRPTAPTD